MSVCFCACRAAAAAAALPPTPLPPYFSPPRRLRRRRSLPHPFVSMPRCRRCRRPRFTLCCRHLLAAFEPPFFRCRRFAAAAFPLVVRFRHACSAPCHATAADDCAATPRRALSMRYARYAITLRALSRELCCRYAAAPRMRAHAAFLRFCRGLRRRFCRYAITLISPPLPCPLTPPPPFTALFRCRR